jgi:hypothetical protein
MFLGSKVQRWSPWWQKRNMAPPCNHTAAKRHYKLIIIHLVISKKIMFQGSKARLVRRADNLTDICDKINNK